MKTIRAAHFDPLGGTETDGIIIEITEKLPELKTLSEADAFHNDQAAAIVAALYETLPQATLNRVVVELMKRIVGHYIGKSEPMK